MLLVLKDNTVFFSIAKSHGDQMIEIFSRFIKCCVFFLVYWKTDVLLSEKPSWSSFITVNCFIDLWSYKTPQQWILLDCFGLFVENRVPFTSFLSHSVSLQSHGEGANFLLGHWMGRSSIKLTKSCSCLIWTKQSICIQLFYSIISLVKEYFKAHMEMTNGYSD